MVFSPLLVFYELLISLKERPNRKEANCQQLSLCVHFGSFGRDMLLLFVEAFPDDLSEEGNNEQYRELK